MYHIFQRQYTLPKVAVISVLLSSNGISSSEEFRCISSKLSIVKYYASRERERTVRKVVNSICKLFTYRRWRFLSRLCTDYNADSIAFHWDRELISVRCCTISGLIVDAQELPFSRLLGFNGHSLSYKIIKFTDDLCSIASHPYVRECLTPQNVPPWVSCLSCTALAAVCCFRLHCKFSRAINFFNITNTRAPGKLFSSMIHYPRRASVPSKQMI